MSLESQTLDGFYKEMYGTQENPIPACSKIQKGIKFISADKTSGGAYVTNVLVTQEHGVSYFTSNAGLPGLNDRVPLVTGKAEAKGSNLFIRSGISYEDAMRAGSSSKAFASIVPMIVEAMTESLSKRLEISLIYGQVDLGSGTTGAVSGSDLVVTFATGEFSGIWAGAENARLAVKVAGGTTFGPFVVTAVDFSAKTLTLQTASDVNGADGAKTGTLTDIDNETVYLYFYGSISISASPVSREMIGIDSVLTTSGSLFGIDNTAYSMWKGNTVSVSGRLTFAKLIAALNIPIQKGGLQEDVTVFVPIQTWQDLNSDQAALRRYDGSYSKSESTMGAQSLKFYGQAGGVEIVAHPYLKESEAFALPVNKWRRIGASEITFNSRGNEKVFIELQDNYGFEIRAMCNQAIMPRLVSTSVKIYGFTNS